MTDTSEPAEPSEREREYGCAPGTYEIILDFADALGRAPTPTEIMALGFGLAYAERHVEGPR